jgi:hypothetical protein
VGLAALTLTGGCLRFGYDVQRELVIVEHDAGARDASAPAGDASAARTDTPDSGARLSDAAVVMPVAGRGGSGASPAAGAGGMDAGPQGGVLDATTAGSGSVDAGATEVGSDAAVGGGVPAACAGRSDVLFCDGFEDPARAQWRSSTTRGTLERTIDRKLGGASALRVTTEATSGSSNMAREEADVFAGQKSGDVWARAFYYLPSSVTVSSAFTALQIIESALPRTSCALVVRSDRYALGGATARFTTLEAFPRDAWVCVEVHVVIDASAGS